MQPSECAKKLRKYLDDNGIRVTWFAKAIGVSQPTLSGYLSGSRSLPPKCFEKVVIVTKGKIKFNELSREFFTKQQSDDAKLDEEDAE